jgi:hypothetical protein
MKCIILNGTPKEIDILLKRQGEKTQENTPKNPEKTEKTIISTPTEKNTPQPPTRKTKKYSKLDYEIIAKKIMYYYLRNVKGSISEHTQKVLGHKNVRLINYIKNKYKIKGSSHYNYNYLFSLVIDEMRNNPRLIIYHALRKFGTTSSNLIIKFKEKYGVYDGLGIREKEKIIGNELNHDYKLWRKEKIEEFSKVLNMSNYKRDNQPIREKRHSSDWAKFWLKRAWELKRMYPDKTIRECQDISRREWENRHKLSV